MTTRDIGPPRQRQLSPHCLKAPCSESRPSRARSEFRLVGMVCGKGVLGLSRNLARMGRSSPEPRGRQAQENLSSPSSKLFSPLLLTDFQDSHFPPTRPKAGQPDAWVLARRRALAWDGRVETRWEDPGAPGAAYPILTDPWGRWRSWGTGPPAPVPFLELTLVPPLSNNKGRWWRGVVVLVTAAHGDHLTPACASGICGIF